MQKRPINPVTLAEPVGHFDHAVRIGHTLHISGMSALSQLPGPFRQRKPPASIEEQTRLVFDNIRKVLQAAGGSMSDIFHLTVLYSRAEDWGTVDRIVREYLPDRGFTRTGFLTVLLHPDLFIEIEVMAILD